MAKVKKNGPIRKKYGYMSQPYCYTYAHFLCHFTRYLIDLQLYII